nr:LTA synthase family protein [Lentibacillus sp. JNUCC-1]
MATESDSPEEFIEGISAKDIIELKGNEYVSFEQHVLHGADKDKNLLIIQVESLQNFVMALTVNGQEITPTINELAKNSLYFNNFFQQIGSGNTSDAEFMMNTSIYPIGEIPTSKQIEGKTIPSLPRTLNEEGYTTSTFHAHEITYWNRDKMYPALGFDEWFAMDFYGEEDIVGFGPSDGHFYKKPSNSWRNIQKMNLHFTLTC